MNKLSSYQRICAGRFHAAIIATILDIPFSAWESNSWKIQGWMKDMGLSELCFGTRAEALSSIPLTPDPKMKTFALSARTKVDESFDRVNQIAAG
jgi:polysaccharide pyruvyl transferase WcaK-like protein